MLSFEEIQSDPVLAGEVAESIRAGYGAARETAFAAGLPEPKLFVTTADDPANHITPTGTSLDGVGDLILTFPTGSSRCTTSLLPNGTHTLTAAHCFFDNTGQPATEATVFFDLPTGTEAINGVSFAINGGFTGNAFDGNDIAILELLNAPSDSVPRFDIYRASDEVGQRFSVAGYGRSGTGNQGDILSSGTKRDGDNRVDVLGEELNGPVYDPGTLPSGLMLVSDFDNGLAANDASGFFLDIDDVGLANDEVSTAPGDSGGPSLIDGKIAAVTSFGQGFVGGPDVFDGTNASFGEFAVNTRVSAFASWIDGVIDIVPPNVLGVSIGTTIGTHSDVGIDPNEQLKTVPVGSANQISITFDEEVTIGQSSLDISGVITEDSYNGDVIDVSFDGGTNTATWTLGNAFPADQIEITLFDTVTDVGGVPLDGEWGNPDTIFDGAADSFPSGDGTFGGEFGFRFTMLPGDANRDNKVGQADLAIMQVNFGQGGGFTFEDGDFDGNGVIDNDTDYNTLFRDNFTRVWSEWGFDFIVGDLNFDFRVDFDDIDDFIRAMTGMLDDIAEDYDVRVETVMLVADIDDNGLLDFDDIDDFITLLIEGKDGLIPDALG